jgi:hypothetical protein
VVAQARDDLYNGVLQLAVGGFEPVVHDASSKARADFGANAPSEPVESAHLCPRSMLGRRAIQRPCRRLVVIER